jgi:CDP-paratose 2-epimerase
MQSNLPKKCLVTGGCGFLGSNIAAHFLVHGSEVVVIDALFREGGPQNLEWLRSLDTQQQFHIIKGDLADQALVQSIFEEHGPFDYICHLGGQVAMTTSLSDPRRDLNTNVIGTFNVLEAMRAHSPDALIAYSSTNKVYGDLEDYDYHEGETRYSVANHPNGFDEQTPLDFASPYGCSKGSADQYVRDWNRNYGLKTVVFRHSSIYGGRQFSTFDQGWIGWFCKNALAQARAIKTGAPPTEFTIAGNGKQVRDVLHAQDLIALYQAAYTNREKAAGQIFNIGGGVENSLSLLELFEALRNKLNLNSPLALKKLPPRQSDQKWFVADISKAAGLLDWKPQVTASEGLDRMLEWTTSCYK